MAEREREVAWNGRGETVAPIRARYDWSSTVPSVAIVETIAAVEGVDPVALAADRESLLGERVDTEALDELVANGHEDALSITVSLRSYTVRIEGPELIVEPAANDPGGPA